MKIADGLHRLGSDPHGTVNSYLVVEGAEVTVVDAGLPGFRRLLVEELATLGLGLHPADAARARKEVTKPSTGWGPVKARPLTGFLWYSARHGGLRIPAVEAVD